MSLEILAWEESEAGVPIPAEAKVSYDPDEVVRVTEAGYGFVMHDMLNSSGTVGEWAIVVQFSFSQGCTVPWMAALTQVDGDLEIASGKVTRSDQDYDQLREDFKRAIEQAVSSLTYDWM